MTEIRQIKQQTDVRVSTYGIALTMAWSAVVICTMVAAYWLMGAAVPIPSSAMDVVVKKGKESAEETGPGRTTDRPSQLRS